LRRTLALPGLRYLEFFLSKFKDYNFPPSAYHDRIENERQLPPARRMIGCDPARCR
jgi:hypothetical protein